MAGLLNIVFGDEIKFKYFVEYLDQREAQLLDYDRNDIESNSRWRTQGKRQLIYELKGLRDKIKMTLEETKNG